MPVPPCAKVTDDGHVECPNCGCNIITPVGYNPYKDREEKMLLNAGFLGQCGICHTVYTVDEEQELKHNHFWFPDDPEFSLPADKKG